MTTDDGYILTLYRIKCKDSSTEYQPTKGPLLLVHGFSSDSYSWSFNGEDPTRPNWAVQLAEEGYDVWMVNTRGTQMSKQHRDGLNSRYSEFPFWNFDNDDIAFRDIPAAVERVLEQNNSCQKITLVGDSNGAAVILKAMSNAPDARKYVQQAILRRPCFSPLPEGVYPGLNLQAYTDVSNGA